MDTLFNPQQANQNQALHYLHLQLELETALEMRRHDGVETARGYLTEFVCCDHCLERALLELAGQALERLEATGVEAQAVIERALQTVQNTADHPHSDGCGGRCRASAHSEETA